MDELSRPDNRNHPCDNIYASQNSNQVFSDEVKRTMIRKGKVVQIILNKDLHKYFSDKNRPAVSESEQMIATKKDLVVLENPDYPHGVGGWFLSFKRNRPEAVFPVLMSAEGVREGVFLEVECETFKVDTICYITEAER